jgi:FKBP-type peptidyl-prolyl cis-trans isomerase FklB
MRKRIGMAILAVALSACGAKAQQAPAKAPATPPAKAPAVAPASGQAAQAPAAKAPAPESAFKTQKEKFSYLVGMEMGKGVKSQQIDVDPEIVLQGLKDGLSDAKPKMSEEEIRQAVAELQQQIRENQVSAAADNKKKGDAFLAENAKKEGVVSLPDGLQYKILSAGQGKKPVESDTVLCNYKGTFIDGKEFDSSARAGKPVPFEIKNVIPGFREILQLMPEGSKWQVFIPSNLAYGERGAGSGAIAPNSALVFEIELVKIQGPAPVVNVPDRPPSLGGATPQTGPPPTGQPAK